MDSKNVIAAIALSSAVIVLWSLFFIPEQQTINQDLVEKEKIEKNTDTPSLDQKEKVVALSRDDALIQNERIEFENDNVIGSISLKGATIDDLTFKRPGTGICPSHLDQVLGKKLMKNIEEDELLCWSDII